MNYLYYNKSYVDCYNLAFDYYNSISSNSQKLLLLDLLIKANLKLLNHEDIDIDKINNKTTSVIRELDNHISNPQLILNISIYFKQLKAVNDSIKYIIKAFHTYALPNISLINQLNELLHTHNEDIDNVTYEDLYKIKSELI